LIFSPAIFICVAFVHIYSRSKFVVVVTSFFFFLFFLSTTLALFDVILYKSIAMYVSILLFVRRRSFSPSLFFAVPFFPLYLCLWQT
jgi:hypothetical protein